MSNSHTVRLLKFSADVATANERHWLDYERLIMRALPEGLQDHQKLMLRAAFNKAWEAAQQEGFENGIRFSRQNYGAPDDMPRLRMPGGKPKGSER